MQYSSSKDLRDLTLAIKSILVECFVASPVYYIAVLINQVPSRVDSLFIVVDEITVCIFVQNWVAQRIILKLSHDVLFVELGEWEDLRELTVFEVLGTPQLLALLVDDVSIVVNKVALFIDKSSFVVYKLSIFVCLRHYVSIVISVELSHSVHDIKLHSRVSVKLRQVIVSIELLSVELLDSIFVNNVAMLVYVESSSVDLLTLSINELSIFILTECWLSILVVVKYSPDIVWVEIKLFD